MVGLRSDTWRMLVERARCRCASLPRRSDVLFLASVSDTVYNMHIITEEKLAQFANCVTPSMTLKPQDLLVTLTLSIHPDSARSSIEIARALGMSASEVHNALRRAIRAGLLHSGRAPNRSALGEFLFHGLKYVFLPDRGGIVRGMPTSYAAPPLNTLIEADQNPPVWPDPNGTVRGEAFSPLYKSAPKAARNDPRLYECLALIDAVRGGRARERKLAEKILSERLDIR